eukprot:CAMPEP_0206135460 /NCGR_PEP_ID=MMETSP1473-20131121/741_1 /ASSEMBLY_ACC=CAM_ASM_001109 /TAXON_ID=1461547 /ORGANISM="Stichococcus sp, Strain RCC1054" /LENGTH=52 /DNA_ID=CAMNT_0053527333 /DNA_START=64 /DNA_END=219 /DNA_ORIENTATION=+
MSSTFLNGRRQPPQLDVQPCSVLQQNRTILCSDMPQCMAAGGLSKALRTGES